MDKQMNDGLEAANENVVISPRRSPRILACTVAQTRARGQGSQQNEKEVIEAPAVGMVFGTYMEVEQFYKKYAEQQEFGVSRTQGSFSTRKERRGTTWRCECWRDPDAKAIAKSKKKAKEMDVGGSTIEEDEATVRKRTTKKCFCTAMVYASMNDQKLWEIRKVVLEHKNHEPVPSMAMLVKEYRMAHFNRSVKRRLLNDTQVGVSVAQIHSAMAKERGGYENMPLTEKDLRHEKNKDRKLRMVGGDSNALIDYFDKMQEDNPAFFHTHRLDEEGKMKDVLWVDARSRAAYEEFSDVVCFDSTYLTNEYTLPFANFVGVNHHGHTVLFRCAMISSENCETFEWVFRKWLMCMKGRELGGILTDQAAAMRHPLEEVMSNTRHRWCIWHILQKLTSKVGQIEGVAEFKDELLEVIYNSMNRYEFESGWSRVVSKYGLEENDWLANLFEERHMWVPSFMTDHFWASMRTTQRVESIHSFFDKFVNRHTMFHEFGEKYTAAIKKRINDEKNADAKSVKWVRNYSTGYSAERFFRKIYTNNKFRVVQKECERLTYVEVREEKTLDDIQFQYLVEDRVWVLPKGYSDEIVTSRRTFYSVMFNAESLDASCACKMFETHGIMCRHLIRVYYRNHIDKIPQKFVLRRWRKDVVRKHTHIKVAHHDKSKTRECRRLDKMLLLYEPVTDLAVKSDRLVAIVERGLRAIETELLEAAREEATGSVSESGGGSTFPESSVPGSSVPGFNVHETDSLASANPCSSVGHRTGASLGLNSACSETRIVQHEVDGSPTSQPQPPKYNIIDPPIPKKKGRPRTTRFKSAVELGSKKQKAQTKKKSEPATSNPTPQQSEPCLITDPSVQPMKIPVKRKVDPREAEPSKPRRKRKAVSFAEDVDREPPLSTPDLGDDDLLHRNLLSFV